MGLGQQGHQAVGPGSNLCRAKKFYEAVGSGFESQPLPTILT